MKENIASDKTAEFNAVFRLAYPPVKSQLDYIEW